MIITRRSDQKGHRTDFPMVPMKGDDGRTIKAYQITCSRCGTTALRKRTNGFADDQFRKIGWLVGNTAPHDVCPDCLMKGKVIKMTDHKKPEPVAAMAAPKTGQRTMSREDGRLLSRSIEDHWDEPNVCYKLGWSDAKIADDMSVPVDWVREIRERDFGGTGDEPGLLHLIASQVEIKRDIAGLSSLMEMMTKDLHSTTALQHDLDKKLDGYRNGHRRLLERIERLDDIATQLQGISGKRSA